MPVQARRNQAPRSRPRRRCTGSYLQRARELAQRSPGRRPLGVQGALPRPGGWNRFAIEVIEVTDLAGTVENLSRHGVRFRSAIITGTGGKQIIADDPSGNPVELFEPTLPEAHTRSGVQPRLAGTHTLLAIG